MSAPAPAIAQVNTGGATTTSGAGSNTPSISDEDRAVAQKMMSQGGRITPESARKRCLREGRPGEIVVCAPDEEKYRIPSTSQEDPESPQALNDGRLHPPDVAGNGIFRGKATMGGMCLVPPCPKTPYLIDLSSIPEAPAGSDADKIAKGEMRAH
ncbi:MULTISPECIES: hypothetical protein [unclassified Novosphingobium]|uniref:hypothetical protein n=1 Tax=Novosphingobium TaxID=165696 RepID=UPI001FB39324|nr:MULTISPECIES: hypothetical protein [unclassified Novosphingobium]WRT93148.1 hypothetical protein U9J33_01095 [Novosphingobium sp. RL4]